MARGVPSRPRPRPDPHDVGEHERALGVGVQRFWRPLVLEPLDAADWQTVLFAMRGFQHTCRLVVARARARAGLPPSAESPAGPGPFSSLEVLPVKACSRFAASASASCSAPVTWVLVSQRPEHEEFAGFCEEHAREMQRAGLLSGHWYHRVPEDQLEPPRRHGDLADALAAKSRAAAGGS